MKDFITLWFFDSETNSLVHEHRNLPVWPCEGCGENFLNIGMEGFHVPNLGKLGVKVEIRGGQPRCWRCVQKQIEKAKQN